MINDKIIKKMESIEESIHDLIESVGECLGVDIETEDNAILGLDCKKDDMVQSLWDFRDALYQVIQERKDNDRN